jgi:hypothetical protein
VSEVIEQRKYNAKGLLHAHEAVERPFAVELLHGLQVRRTAGKARVGDNVLARVVALGGTVPEKELAVECCYGVS